MALALRQLSPIHKKGPYIFLSFIVVLSAFVGFIDLVAALCEAVLVNLSAILFLIRSPVISAVFLIVCFEAVLRASVADFIVLPKKLLTVFTK